MMAVDLNDLVSRLQAEVNPPGVDLFPDATTNDFLLHLQNGFWEAALDGIVSGYTVDDDGVVTPTSGTTDISSELQQVVIFYAGMKIIRNLLLNLKTKFRTVAGPVEYETQQSANTLREILLDLKTRRNILLERLSDVGVTESYLVDAVTARSDALVAGDTFWVSSGDA